MLAQIVLHFPQQVFRTEPVLLAMRGLHCSLVHFKPLSNDFISQSAKGLYNTSTEFTFEGEREKEREREREWHTV